MASNSLILIGFVLSIIFGVGIGLLILYLKNRKIIKKAKKEVNLDGKSGNKPRKEPTTESIGEPDNIQGSADGVSERRDIPNNNGIREKYGGSEDEESFKRQRRDELSTPFFTIRD